MLIERRSKQMHGLTYAENPQIGFKIEKLSPQVARQNIGAEKFQTLPDLVV
jgi:hypothetical protein